MFSQKYDRNLAFYRDLNKSDAYQDALSISKPREIELNLDHPLYDKWIYLFGDSTMRQIFEVIFKTVNSNNSFLYFI